MTSVFLEETVLLRPLRSFGITTLYTGPMTAGKSDALISDFNRRLKYGRQCGSIFRPVVSKRDDHDRHESRNGESCLCTFFESLEHLRTLVNTDENVIGIDEIHFLDDPMALVRFIESIQARGQDVLLGGVDTNFLGEAFPTVSAVMNLDNIHVHRLHAWCTVCGFEARWSQLMGEPPIDGSIIQTGYDYEARCTEHFEPRQMMAVS